MRPFNTPGARFELRRHVLSFMPAEIVPLPLPPDKSFRKLIAPQRRIWIIPFYLLKLHLPSQGPKDYRSNGAVG
jgi:hypothetical protein